MRIAWSDDYGYAPVDSEVVEVCSAAAREFEQMGCTVDDPNFALDSPQEHFRVVFATNSFASSGYLLDLRPDDLTDYFRESMEFAATLTAADYARALGGFDEVRVKFDALFERYDLLLSPTMAVAAFPIGEHPNTIGGRPVDDPSFGYLPFTYPINSIGHPAASVPCGFSESGLPIGLHIVGRKGDEETVLAASAAFERGRPWARLRPDGVVDRETLALPPTPS